MTLSDRSTFISSKTSFETAHLEISDTAEESDDVDVSDTTSNSDTIRVIVSVKSVA